MCLSSFGLSASGSFPPPQISLVNVISLFFHKPLIAFSPLLFLRSPIISGEQLDIEGIAVPKEVVVFAASAVVGVAAKRFRELRSPTRKALQRAVFYFKEPIRCLLIGSTRSFHTWNSYEIVQLITTYKTSSVVSPIPVFSSFTANQTILDAFIM
ncbi:unnamed protein product [Lactuca saligna]|uniref:Uncharacterized protein n=1 Tax=Lactuca saligna TaxID=75948 RepID=A0AA35YSP8_LACSI|nr:unnamed protein product [Lactuca saligna]